MLRRRVEGALGGEEGAAGAGRGRLHGEPRATVEVRQEGVGIAGDDDDGVVVAGGGEGGEDVVDDGETADGVEGLRQGRPHPGADPGGQNDCLPRAHRSAGHHGCFSAG